MPSNRQKPVSAWSLDERLHWGSQEDALRRQDLALVTDAVSLGECQVKVKQRRNAVGASRGQAFAMITEAQRAAKLAAIKEKPNAE